MEQNRKSVVAIVDYDFDDVEIERSIIEGAGFELVDAHCTTENDVIAVARDADAVIAQYAHVGPRTSGGTGNR